jgi:nicotinate phosphoribosyltransferase
MIAQALHTDFYQITMAAVYHARGLNGSATFSLFTHDLPSSRGYMVAAGLEDALDFLEAFSFEEEELAYLKSLNRFAPGFLEMLRGMRFSGEVWAVPEGTVCFGGEPFIEVTAPLMEAQLVETRLINIFNLQTTLASKAARCVCAAQGRKLVDFSLRRTQGLQAGLAAARSSALVGFSGTSNVAAAQAYGLVPVGTMAHSFVEAFGNEEKAFMAFAETFPKASVFLVDTYDSLEGVRHAVRVAEVLAKQGHKLVGVRLDSGDLAGMSREARHILDEAGLKDVAVVASGSLDEMNIAQLVKAGAAIDMFGVGTRMGSSADAPYLDFAYKLVSYQGRPTLKLSTGKVTWVGSKQVWRTLDQDGRIAADQLCLREEAGSGRPLLEQVMAQGRRTGPRTGWREGLANFLADSATLPEACLRLESPDPLRFSVSPALISLQETTRQAALAAQAQ